VGTTISTDLKTVLMQDGLFCFPVLMCSKIKNIIMSKEIDRRNFIKIIFGTVSTAAISGPTADLWPVAAKKRPTADPIVFHLENGYIVDPDFDPRANWPTIRENRYENLDEDDQVSFLIDWMDGTVLTEFEEEFGKPYEKWSKKELPALEGSFESRLDEDEDPDYLSFSASADCSEYSAGIQVLDELGDQRAKELGLYLVEGDHPGSSFCGVAFDGEVELLNLEFARRGLNLKLRA
jgi:hypothetical protein